MSPVFSSTISLGTTSLLGIVILLPFLNTLAVDEASDLNESIVFSAWYLIMISRQLDWYSGKNLLLYETDNNIQDNHRSDKPSFSLGMLVYYLL